MKDLLAVVAANARPARWWVSFSLGPFDFEPTGYTTRETEHQLTVSLEWLLREPHFTDCARDHLAGLSEIPKLAAKKGYKRTARLTQLLIREGDARSAPIVARVYKLAKGDPTYHVPIFSEMAHHPPAGKAWRAASKLLER